MTRFRRKWKHHNGKGRPAPADVAVDVTMDNEEVFIDTLAGDWNDWVWAPEQRHDRITRWRYSTMRPLPDGVEE